MLFNAYEFIFFFLPITLAGFFLLSGARRGSAAKAWLVLASLFFYAYWNPAYLPLLLVSLAVNYRVSSALMRVRATFGRKVILVLGLAFNLGLLGYFKYANFFVESFNALAGTQIRLAPIVLPLAISFFTFEQIAYLVDTFWGTSKRYGPVDYGLFLIFFPQLIAGPIVHSQEMLPQFAGEPKRFRADDLAIGITMFLIGLFEKVLIADTVARYATPVFAAAAGGATLSLLEAWGGTLAYTLQLYFDFSGYSDMAIGLGRMFGIRIPLNFDAPYQAVNIVDFWRRWHITLSRWLREYLYIPLGGNRQGSVRRYANLFITMLLGGLWHGAGWTFVFWGALHGVYLIINHAWSALAKLTGLAARFNNRWGRTLSRGLTFLAVVIGWVFFRAESWDAAIRVLWGMMGRSGLVLPSALANRLATLEPLLAYLGGHFGDMVAFDSKGLLVIVPLLFVVWLAPTPQQWMADTKPTLEAVAPSRLRWRPTALVGLALGGLLFLVVKGYFTLAPSEFLYFNF